MIRLLLILFLMSCFSALTSRAEVVWFDGKQPITYSLPKEVEPVVTTALEMWKDDMRQVTGMDAVASRKATIKISHNSRLPFDGFCIHTKGGQIIVEGGNGRGMAYGILELSRLAGVSPWTWWGDVVPERKGRLVLSEDFRTVQQPSIAYRGIFINDEDWSLRPWSSKTYEKSQQATIGVQTYKRIFQLLLRLRANTIWPAMHEGSTPFFQIPGAQDMADSCGIVIGTSHCEPLLRNNVGEWDTAQRGRFNYKTNRMAVQQYWKERLQEIRSADNKFFTIGMRGIHDSSMEGYTTEQEKFEALQQVIDDQQVLLRQYVGDPTRLHQVFVPYKEVLQLYEKGLKVPDYVTLMWCDDNYGYMTRLPNATEQQRRGGHALYYHLSYWGRPHDYLWLTTTQPGLIYHELRQAYDSHVRQLWIANVHDPKVAAYDLQLFLDMAWDINCVTPQTINQHHEQWLKTQFGSDLSRRLAPAMRCYYQLCAMRRPEFMGWTQVELDKRRFHRGLSLVDTIPMTRQEADNRLAAFDAIVATIDSCRRLLPPTLADAYFAAVEYPVKATAAMNRKMLAHTMAVCHQAYDDILQLTARYNRMNNGKWHHLMDAAPRQLPVFGDVHATLTGKGQGLTTTYPAADYTTATDGTQCIQMLGYSMNAVKMRKGGVLSYNVDISQEGYYTLQTALIPTHPIDGGDLRFSMTIDGGEPTLFSLREPFRSERWKDNVLNCQTKRAIKVWLTKGVHQLTLTALDENIVIDQWQLTQEIQ